MTTSRTPFAIPPSATPQHVEHLVHIRDASARTRADEDHVHRFEIPRGLGDPLYGSLGDADPGIEREGDVAAAKQWARRAWSFDPDDETALGALLSLLLRVGDRCGAMHEYARFGRRLWREYQMAPSAEIDAIIRPLRVPASPSLR